MQEMALDRRQFLVSVSLIAGGMALRIGSAEAAPSAARGPWGPDARAGNELSAWIEISADNTVTIRTPTPEIGNGAMTQIGI